MEKVARNGGFIVPDGTPVTWAKRGRKTTHIYQWSVCVLPTFLIGKSRCAAIRVFTVNPYTVWVVITMLLIQNTLPLQRLLYAEHLI